MNALEHHRSISKPHPQDRLRTISKRLQRAIELCESLRARSEKVQSTRLNLTARLERNAASLDSLNRKQVVERDELQSQLGALDAEHEQLQQRCVESEASLTATLREAAGAYRDGLTPLVDRFLDRFIEAAVGVYRNENRAGQVADACDAAVYLRAHLRCQWFATPVLPTARWVLDRLTALLKTGEVPWPPPPPMA